MDCYVAKMHYTKAAVISAFLFLLAFAGIGELKAAGADSQLHDEVAMILKSEGLTGAVWATMSPDTGIRIDAVGVRDADTGQPLQASDRIHIGSITKTLIATGVLSLVTQDKLALDTPVSEVLPDLEFENAWATSDPVRIRHLLDHSAGLDDARLWQILSVKPHVGTPLADAFKRDSSLLKVRTRPGSRFSYSNMSYTLLGMVIESVTGEAYERYLGRELLKPLAMTNSTFEFVSQKDDPGIAMGHFENGQAHVTVPMYLRPAGQFTTTAQDMALFAGFLMGDGIAGNKVLIEQKLLRSMGKPFETEAAEAGLKVGYGLGLFTRDRNGAVGLCHGGDTSGFHAMLCIFPENKSAFFVSINTGSEIAEYNRIDKALLKSLTLETGVSDHELAPSNINISEWEGFYVPAPNRISSFEYVDTILNFATLRADGKNLRFRPFQSKEVYLMPAGGDFFRAGERLLASHVFIVTADGSRILTNGSQSFERASLPRLGFLWASLALGLAGLIYIFLSGVLLTLTRRFRFASAIAIPFLGILALLLPLPFFLTQSFMQVGDLTVASGILAVVTALLPLSMISGLWRHFGRSDRSRIQTLDAMAMLAVLQWTLVLAFWGLMPLTLWT